MLKLKKYFFIIPLILFTVTIILIIRIIKIRKKYIKIKGVIESFDIKSDDEYNNIISPVISYEIENKKYESKINWYTESMKVGDEIDILYNPLKKDEAVSKNGTLLTAGVTGVLAIFFLIAYIIILLI